MTENVWRKARKKPVIIEFREVEPNPSHIIKEPLSIGEAMSNICETIETLEGTLMAFKNSDYIIRDVEGKIYPIKKTLFEKIYSRIYEVTDDDEEDY